MKNLKIEAPKGYEIDKEKSTFENIVFKKIENELPMSCKEIKGRVPEIWMHYVPYNDLGCIKYYA